MGEELVLRASRAKWALVLLIGAGFAVIGALMARDGRVLGWAVAGFFGLVAIVGLVVVIRPSELRLDAEGVRFGRGRVRWREVARFRAGRIGVNKMVLIDYAPAAGVHAGRKVAAALTGAEGALPDTYGKSAEELVALLEEWRVRYTP